MLPSSETFIVILQLLLLGLEVSLRRDQRKFKLQNGSLRQTPNDFSKQLRLYTFKDHVFKVDADSLQEIVFPYAWTSYNVLVLPPSFPYGGMENPVYTFATPTIISGVSQFSRRYHGLVHRMYPTCYERGVLYSVPVFFKIVRFDLIFIRH